MSESFITFVCNEIAANKFSIGSKWHGATQFSVVFAEDAKWMLFIERGTFSWLFKRMCLKRFHNHSHYRVNITRAESKMLLKSYKYALEENKRRANATKVDLKELGYKLRNMEEEK